MKKITVTVILCMFFLSAYTQNIQLHRDFGEGRNYFTSTIEMFKPDKWGNTFFFVDFNYDAGDVNGVSLAYMEIARNLQFWEAPVAIHVEYNGGFGQWAKDTIGGVFQIHDAWLGGATYSWHNTDFSKTLSISAMYKYIDTKQDASFQITLVWGANFFKDKLSFNGFVDFWREDNVFENEKTKFVLLSEPQLWYNFTKNFSVGSEVELSYNFAGLHFKAMPTAAVKWTF